MINFAALQRLSKHPLFADYFAFVLPIFWPVLFWQLRRMAGQMTARGCCEILIQVSWWGGIEITHYGDRAPSPSAYRPLPPLRKAWDDPCWSSTVPAFLGGEASAVIFPCFSGGFEGKAFALQTPREGMKGPCALPVTADTS